MAKQKSAPGEISSARPARQHARAVNKAQKRRAKEAASTGPTAENDPKPRRKTGSAKSAPKRKRGNQPFVLDEEQGRQVEACAAFGLSLDETAVVIGISTSTLFKHKAVFEEHLSRGSMIAKSRVNRSLYENAVAGSIGHITMWHKVVRGWSEKMVSELSGPGGGPIQTTQTLLTDEELWARITTVSERNSSVVHKHDADTVALEDG